MDAWALLECSEIFGGEKFFAEEHGSEPVTGASSRLPGALVLQQETELLEESMEQDGVKEQVAEAKLAKSGFKFKLNIPVKKADLSMKPVATPVKFNFGGAGKVEFGKSPKSDKSEKEAESMAAASGDSKPPGKVTFAKSSSPEAPLSPTVRLAHYSGYVARSVRAAYASHLWHTGCTHDAMATAAHLRFQPDCPRPEVHTEAPHADTLSVFGSPPPRPDDVKAGMTVLVLAEPTVPVRAAVVSAPAPVVQPNKELVVEVGMRLEAKDRKNPSMICCANVIEVHADNSITINFDGWGPTYNYRASLSDGDFHPVGYCAHIQHKLESPRGHANFTWESYLKTVDKEPLPASLLTHPVNQIEALQNKIPVAKSAGAAYQVVLQSDEFGEKTFDLSLVRLLREAPAAQGVRDSPTPAVKATSFSKKKPRQGKAKAVQIVHSPQVVAEAGVDAAVVMEDAVVAIADEAERLSSREESVSAGDVIPTALSKEVALDRSPVVLLQLAKLWEETRFGVGVIVSTLVAAETAKQGLYIDSALLHGASLGDSLDCTAILQSTVKDGSLDVSADWLGFGSSLDAVIEYRLGSGPRQTAKFFAGQPIRLSAEKDTVPGDVSKDKTKSCGDKVTSRFDKKVTFGPTATSTDFSDEKPDEEKVHHARSVNTGCHFCCFLPTQSLTPCLVLSRLRFA